MSESQASIKTDDAAYFALLKKCLTASLYDESAWRLVEGPMPSERSLAAMVKRSVIKALHTHGIRLVRVREFNAASREQGLDWPMFGFTMVGTRRLDNIQSCLEDILRRKVPGDYVETGVWRGGSSIFAKALFRYYGADDRVVWCCDSFEGMPKPGTTDREIDPGSDFSDRTWLVASQEQVAENFRRFGLLDANVRFVKGWFSESLPRSPIGPIAILRMDGDLYASTMDALTNLYRKMSPGGYVIVDDYKSWRGCRQAVDEFRAQNGISAPLEDIDAHAVFWKLREA